jgi:thiol-disulfide isomerase/thioredoxin
MLKNFFLLVIVLAAGNALAQSEQKTAQLEFRDIRGRAHELKDYRGQVVLLNFWATWCPPCRQEIPDLIKMQRNYRARGLRIIGLTYPPEKLAVVSRFVRRLKMNYPVALGTKSDKTLFTATETLPVTVVIDRDGTVRDVIEGIMFSDEFDEKVKPLLLNKSAPGTGPPKSLQQSSTDLQTARIIVGARGYRPASIRLRRNVPARLTFIRNVEQTCGREIVIPAYAINQAVPLNVPVTVAFTPNRTGRFKMTCGMDMFRGFLVVR